MTDSINPDMESMPPKVASKRENVAVRLESLFSLENSADAANSEGEPIPGATDSFYPEETTDSPDINTWASDLELMTKEMSSAMGRSRALLVASHLYRKLGNQEKSYECARVAAETSPRLGMAALTLRKQARERSDKETILQSLEATARHASDSSTRAHAHRHLASQLEAEGRRAEAGQILDQAARSGDADDALRFARITHRLAQGDSLAGLEIPENLKQALAITQEAIGSARRTVEDTTAPQLQEFSVLRAARQLAESHTSETLAWLKQTELPETALLELESELYAAEPEGRAKAIQVLQDLASREPARRVLRRLAGLVAGSSTPTDLFKVLQLADPGSGTFSIEERWLLSAWSGQPLALGRDDAFSLAQQNPSLAIALGPVELPAVNVPEASDAALLAQVGAGLLNLTTPGANTPFSEAALEALEELKSRGNYQRLIASLDLVRARASKDHLQFAENLLRLSDEPRRASGGLIAGALYQGLGALTEAEEGYRLALAGSEELLTSTSRGLLELGTDDAPALLAAASARVEDPSLSFIQKLAALLHAPAEGRARRALDAILSLTESAGVETSTSVTTIAQESALALALSSALSKENDQGAAESALALARRDLSSRVGQLVYLREHWEKISAPTLTGPLGRDPAVRMLAFFQGSKVSPDRGDEIASQQASSAQADFRYPASEILLYLARSIMLDDLAHAAMLGSLCSEVDRLTMAIGIDMHKAFGNTAELTPLWLERVKSGASESGRLYAYERLVELDEQLGNHQGALLWLKTLVEENPHHVPSLLKWEERLLEQGHATLPATEKLALALPPEESNAYRLIFGARALSQSDLRSARKYLEPLLEGEAPPLLALRGLATVAQEKRDENLLLQVYEKLSSHQGTDLDNATRALTRALIHARLGDLEQSIICTERAIVEKPGAIAAHQLLAYLKKPEDDLVRAEQLEAFALSAAAGVHRSELFFLAGQAFDAAEDGDRAAECYERTLESTPDHREAFNLLCARREAQGALDVVEKYIKQRLSLLPVGNQEHFDLELRLAALLSQQDRAEEAKQHLEVALASHPGHPGALRAHADISAQLGAHESAEKSLVALRDRLEPGGERTLVMRSLARLYDEHLDQAEKAMDAYQALLKEAPGDERARADLVRIYCKLGLAERATNLQTQIIQEADSPEKKRNGALVLAAIYENVAGDPTRASATLERTRKAWPLDADVLEATVRFMDRQGIERQGMGGPRGFLLDRAGKEARRKLESGRLDAGLIDTLARVARLSGQEAQAQLTDAARYAYLGIAFEPLRGAGLTALDPKVDEIIAPQGLPSPLRNLLRKTGAAMDAAFSVDLSAIGAERLTAGATFERLAQIARAFGSDPPELFVSAKLGPKCMPLTTEPARLLIGAELDNAPERERDYLLLRALKLRWLGAGALSRSKDEDRLPMLVALLHLFAPSWQPKNVDGRKAAQARALIEQGLARVGYDDDVPLLALEVIGALGMGSGNQSANVGELPRILANRVALLGIGDPSVALQAMARTEGSKLGTSGPSRFRFIESHHEARDLLLFCTTDKCARAAEALGLLGSGSLPHASGEAVAPGPMKTRAPALPRRPQSTPGAAEAPETPEAPRRPPPPPKRS